MDLNQFKKLPVMGILRGITSPDLKPLIETVAETDLKTIEIALNTEDAINLINVAVDLSKGKLTVGAGTVLSKKDAEEAVNAGATFIVSPVCISEVASYCKKNNIPFFPGAITPKEIFTAWQAGATMVKVFPASLFGPSYFKAIKGPFNDIELMAVGGVTFENVRQYFLNGASACAFGASIFRKEWLDNKDFSSIRKNIQEFVTAVPRTV